MEQPESSNTRAATTSSSKPTRPSLELAAAPHPFGSSSRAARHRPTPSAAVRAASAPPSSERSMPGFGRWGSSASPAGFAGPSSGSSPAGLALEAAPAAAASTLASDNPLSADFDAAAGRRATSGESAGWAGGGGNTPLFAADGPEGRGGGGEGPGGAWGLGGREQGSGDGDDDNDSGGDSGGDDGDDGDRGDYSDDRIQPWGARARRDLPHPGGRQARSKESSNERSAVEPGACGRRLYHPAAGERDAFPDVGGGSGHDDDGAVGSSEDEDDGGDGADGGFRLQDAETDAQESRAKTAQRQIWIRRKDAAMAKFRRDCEAETARIKCAVEDHVREMESMLDEELIQALDGSIAEKIGENQREKARARKIESLMSAFFCDPRVPKAPRVA